jgi:hypothetical protein
MPLNSTFWGQNGPFKRFDPNNEHADGQAADVQSWGQRNKRYTTLKRM